MDIFFRLILKYFYIKKRKNYEEGQKIKFK